MMTLEADSRARMLDLPLGFVEDLRRVSAAANRGPAGHCSDFQICLPYRGLFVWHVGGDDVVGDPNQIVFVRAGEAFRMSSPSPRGYAEPRVSSHSHFTYAFRRVFDCIPS